MDYKVISTSPLWVKESPSSDARNITVIYPDAVVTALDTDGTWIKILSGWVNTKSIDGEYTYLETVEENTNISTTAISVGDTVTISSNSATYIDTGETIPNSEKESSYTVDALSEDGSVALLNFSSSRILTSTFNLMAATPETNQTEVTKTDIEKSGADSSKEATEKSKSTVKDALSVYTEYVKKQYGEYTDSVINDIKNRLGKMTNEKVSKELTNFDITDVTGIFGIPYQYLKTADRRVSGSGDSAIGRKYGERIIARMPLLLITPGVPEFMPGYSNSEQGSIMKFMANIGHSNLEDCIKKSGKYYSLRYDKQSYYKYVNPLCRLGARLLNIQNIELPTTNGESCKLDSYNWDDYVQTAIHDELSYRSSIAFYIDSEKQISDSFGNQETESQLANKVNGVSEMGREINFLLGTASAQTGIEFDAFTNGRNIRNNEVNNGDFVSRMQSSGNTMSTFLKNIGTQMKTVFAGGRLIFPKIWADSSFGRQYNVNIRLTSPNQDVLSWYLDCFVPLIHLVCLTAPRQSGPNGYVSPFLIKAYYKGLFNCDLGLITDLNITKGSEGGWTRNGLPTSIDVSFTIRDLYESISITSDDGDFLTANSKVLQNIILMDYIANLCGVNVNRMDLWRTIDFYFTQIGLNRYKDWARLDVFGGLDRWITNKVLGVYTRD